ncbi:MAG: DUF2442 domain-containing protein [Sulfurimonas sp.]|uniref:DUF2442 domain-containing protein n=1 Tax=Sulfurimonas sp. TaxID=2022749 RepID=UPI000CCE9FD4|nr:MAG: hypothetical protein C0627_00415 [Sulfurimonas sp.]
MINLTKASLYEDYKVKLYFSDNSFGILDFSYLLKANTVLTKPLEDSTYFKKFFIDFGALCWKNGLELSAESLYLKLKNQGNLHFAKDVA